MVHVRCQHIKVLGEGRLMHSIAAVGTEKNPEALRYAGPPSAIAKALEGKQGWELPWVPLLSTPPIYKQSLDQELLVSAEQHQQEGWESEGPVWRKLHFITSAVTSP